ncbi:hypothetical protein [Deinococcus sp. UR1]|uniref:hypothetical protein n=1 Tax=Deinococcus sp. UR1 TaxID=1704277 RepID=UPI0006DCA80F|nr:hypothetical protein [Deinococcus sp. UR1]PIG97167.1 hypothetical protein AMD26_014220 [Deinococcus sp. UR1]
MQVMQGAQVPLTHAALAMLTDVHGTSAGTGLTDIETPAQTDPAHLVAGSAAGRVGGCHAGPRGDV